MTERPIPVNTAPVLACALALLAATLGDPKVPPDPDAAGALARVYAAGDFQTGLPFEGAFDGSARAPAAVTPRVHELFDPHGLLARAVELLAWAIAAAVVLASLLWVGRRLSLGQRDAAAPDPAAAQQAPLDHAPLVDAEALARQGRFAEAIRLLLALTFGQLLRGAGARLLPGWTGREVVARVECGPGPRAALAELVAAVEASSFAGRQAGAPEWERCAALFRRLLVGLRGGGR